MCKKYLVVLILILTGMIFGKMPSLTAQNSHDGITLSIHIRGVFESKISLLPLAGPKAYKPVLELASVKDGEAAVLNIPSEYLPGEFVVRFDYKEKPESTPYPSEKQLIVGNQALELWVHPMFANNRDSSYYQEGEKENAAFARFSSENALQRNKIGLLQQFLMEYDQPESDFYRQGIAEYEKRRQAYNHWLEQKTIADKALFVSVIYRFSYLPEINFTGSEKARLENLIDGYFEGPDFNDPNIIRTSKMNEWMNTYVNLHGQMATTIALRDSLIPAAARKAIEKAKTGHPMVYGWMVDYFYRGFEANDIPQGMKVLEPYLSDPACLTSKRMEIDRRLKGMESLTVRTLAPDFMLPDNKNLLFQLSKFKTEAKYILLLFWSADCSHCQSTISALYPWSQLDDNQRKASIIAVSLDETEAEILAWEKKTSALKGWKHLRAKEGINSRVANDYYILATPVMLVLDSKTMEIKAMPSTFSQFEAFIDQ